MSTSNKRAVHCKSPNGSADAHIRMATSRLHRWRCAHRFVVAERTIEYRRNLFAGIYRCILAKIIRLQFSPWSRSFRSSTSLYCIHVLKRLSAHTAQLNLLVGFPIASRTCNEPCLIAGSQNASHDLLHKDVFFTDLQNHQQAKRTHGHVIVYSIPMLHTHKIAIPALFISDPKLVTL